MEIRSDSDAGCASVIAFAGGDPTATADHKIDVEAPLSTRRAFGRSSIVLASTDEAAEADDLRASFQSQLNQQSDAFRNTNVQSSQPIADSARINVVNAPVGNGGK